MNKRFIRIALIVIIVGILTFLILRRAGVFDRAETEAAAQGGQAVPVEVVILEPITLEDKISSTGTIIPKEEVSVTSEASGKVQSIHFTEGTAVRRGQLLVKLNDSELQAQLDKARHQHKLAREQMGRQGQLLDKEAISQDAYEQTVTQVNSLQADINLINAQIDKTNIYAPFSGIVGLRHVSEGAYIAPNTKIADLIDYRTVYIDFNVPERYAGTIERGTRINFSLQGTDGQNLAEVVAIEPRINPGTRTFKVRAAYDNDGLRIMPGAFAQVEIILKELENSLVVPHQAIIPELGGQKVFVVQNGKADPRPVTTGIRAEDHVQVLTGLEPSDTVIVSGAMQVRPGTPVNISQTIVSQ